MKVTLFATLAVFFIIGQAQAGGKMTWSWGEAEYNTRTSTYSYQYVVNGCDTGKLTFNSKESYCLGLADDELNNSCAGEFRCDAFKKNCLDLYPDADCN